MTVKVNDNSTNITVVGRVGWTPGSAVTYKERFTILFGVWPSRSTIRGVTQDGGKRPG